VFREYYPERNVIQEERKMRYDSNPKSRLYEYFNSIAFGFSPYGKPVIGYANNIPKLTYKDTKSFFEKNYIPSRMVIAVSGDIEFEETVKILKKYFEAIEAKPASDFPPIEYEMPTGRKTGELSDTSTPYMITGWNKPSVFDPDNTAYEILSHILTDGQTSRLIKKLVIEKKIAQSISAYNGVPAEKLNNQFAIFVSAYDENQYENIYNEIKEEIENIRKNGVSTQEILRVKNRIYKDLLDTLNSNAGMSDLLSYYELMKSNYGYLFKYLDEIEKIDSDDLKRIIEKSFKDENNTTVWIKKPL
jgi:predicted Zn-dependent peptidase